MTTIELTQYQLKQWLDNQTLEYFQSISNRCYFYKRIFSDFNLTTGGYSNFKIYANNKPIFNLIIKKHLFKVGYFELNPKRGKKK